MGSVIVTSSSPVRFAPTAERTERTLRRGEPEPPAGAYYFCFIVPSLFLERYTFCVGCLASAHEPGGVLLRPPLVAVV